MPPALPQPPHRPEPEAGRNLGLDLLRAAAILLVMLSHWANNFGVWLGAPVPPRVFFAGDLGVALFFVLSGFLIGRILIGLAEAAPTPRNLLIFLARRALRTLPPYFLWLAVMLVLWPPGQQPWRTALRLLTLTQNLFAPMPPDDYFAVSWSLTIEEWFYLLFGASLLLAARAFGARRALALCLAAVILGPLALRLGEWDWSARGLALTKLVFFRLDEIGYGVLMAWLSGGRSRLFRAPWACLALGLPLIGLTWAGVLPVGRALAVNAVVIGCALCLPAALRLRAAPGWCATPVRWLATRSYTLYLVHETILINVAQAQVLGPARLAPSLGIAAAILLPLLLAELSYRFVERPILRRRPPQQVAHRAPAALRAPA